MITWPGGEMPEEEFEEHSSRKFLPDGLDTYDTADEGEGPVLAGVELLSMTDNGGGEWLECDPEHLQDIVDSVKKKFAAAGWPDVEVKLHFGLI